MFTKQEKELVLTFLQLEYYKIREKLFDMQELSSQQKYHLIFEFSVLISLRTKIMLLKV